MSQLKKLVTQFQASDKGCKKVFCTTCGGLSAAVNKHISIDLQSKIIGSLTTLSFSNFLSLGQWRDFFATHYSSEVTSIVEQEANRINEADIKELERFLLDARHWAKNSITYQRLLARSVEVALIEKDESLVETLSIIYGTNLTANNDLFTLALQMYPNHKGIHRVLYNNFRETMPEFRKFLGDGNSRRCPM